MASLGNQEGTHVMKMITFSNKNSILFHSNLNIKIPLGRMKILSITMMLEVLSSMKLSNLSWLDRIIVCISFFSL